MAKIRVAIAGLGNCAAALIQGVYYYANRDDEFIPGVLHPVLGGYRISDIEFVAAFDVAENKIGKDVSEAIFEPPNVVPRFAEVPRLGVEVKPGPILDGVAPHMVDSFKPYDESRIKPVDVADELKSARADILINYLPVGSEKASRYYARQALEAGVAFINAIPVFIASDPSGEWPERYKRRGVPLLGDDIKGQLGATVLHRTLIRLFHMRGVIVDETYQLNVGGNTDFLNMTVEERLHSKRISKTRAVTSLLPYGERLEREGRVRIGPSDYVPFLGNTKVAYIYIKGRSFANFPVIIDLKLVVDDKSQSAGIMIDAIRTAKVALDRGIGGAIPSVSAFFFKHPPVQAPSDEEALKWLEEFISGARDW